MNPTITPEQTKQLASWVGQRDLILVDISNLRTEKEGLTKTNLELAESNTEIQNKIQQSVGRLEELEKKEKEVGQKVSAENAVLGMQKTQLETQLEYLKKEIGLLECERITLIGMFGDLKNVHTDILGNANEMNKTVGENVKLNSQSTVEIKNLLVEIKGELQKIHDVNEQNVSKTNVVINDLPRIIFDLQKDIAERKKFNKVKLS
jgi:chromosome segregation ATPase